MNLITQSLMNKLRIYVLRKIPWNLCHRYYLKMEGEHHRLTLNFLYSFLFININVILKNGKICEKNFE